jgi:Lon protease-like protein
MQRGADFPQGVVAVLPEPEVDVPAEVLDRARATFTAFRAAMTELQGDPFSGTLPRDPDYLAWTLSALTPLPMAERQSLLEAADATERLVLVTRLLTEELRAINVIPSLPATQVARTAWSPN